MALYLLSCNISTHNLAHSRYTNKAMGAYLKKYITLILAEMLAFTLASSAPNYLPKDLLIHHSLPHKALIFAALIIPVIILNRRKKTQ